MGPFYSGCPARLPCGPLQAALKISPGNFFTTPAGKNQNLFCQPATTFRLAG
ncbi:hypothetical protein DDI_1714 [Dickeya dianthicola RNS04.9]|nr:hypothetical protein DDI_1714 [Dickeya dianthicola RNS04.9]